LRAGYGSKVKTPLELAASPARALDADIQWLIELTSWASRMGDPQYDCQPPTEYSEKSATWVNTGALLDRLNFALVLVGNRVSGAQRSLASLFGAEASSDPNMVLSRDLDIFLGGEAAQSTREVLISG
jgi:uncharacterized protein (DUF1800 family)